MTMKVGRRDAENDGVEDKDIDDNNFRSKGGDDGNSMSKGDYEDRWCFQLEGIQTVTDTPTPELDKVQMIGLWARSDEARNLGSWVWRCEELRTLEMTQEHEDKDEEGDKMERNKNTRLMCQWLVLKPLKGTMEVTSIYISSGIEYL